MLKSTRKYFLVVFLMLLLCVSVGVYNRQKFYSCSDLNQLEKEKDLDICSVCIDPIVVSGTAKEYMHKNEWKFEELEKKADLIVKVRVDEKKERTIRGEDISIRTPLIIEEVYKGDRKEQEEIWAYEYASFYYDEQNESYCCYSMDGYCPMEKGRSYYVFLQELPCREGYKKNEQERNTYLFWNCCYAKVPVEEQKVDLLKKQKLDGMDGNYFYKELKEEGIWTADKKVLEKYKKLEEMVREKYHS